MFFDDSLRVPPVIGSITLTEDRRRINGKTA
jgi:hypothetical protein